MEPGAALGATGPTLTLGLTEGHLVKTTNHRRAAAFVLMLVTAMLATVALAAPAQATAYRYWSYWQGASGTWVAAQTGPGDYTLVDEDVQGWRFAITSDNPAAAPDNAPDFATLCPDLAAASVTEGDIRAAVVLDSGFTADAPDGQTPPADVVSCVTVPEGSTGNQALAAAGAVTEDGGLVCAINGYPTDECGAEVSDADAAAASEAAAGEQPNPGFVAEATTTDASTAESTSTETTSTNSSAGFIVGGLILLALVAAAFLIPRRRRAQADQQGS